MARGRSYSVDIGKLRSENANADKWVSAFNTLLKACDSYNDKKKRNSILSFIGESALEIVESSCNDERSPHEGRSPLDSPSNVRRNHSSKSTEVAIFKAFLPLLQWSDQSCTHYKVMIFFVPPCEHKFLQR